MLPDVERGGAPGVTKFEKGSRIDAEPRPAPALPSRALDRLSLPGFLWRPRRDEAVRECTRAPLLGNAPIASGRAGPNEHVLFLKRQHNDHLYDRSRELSR
jgi:hypothetical protein